MKTPISELWDELNVTADEVPKALRAIASEPPQRRQYLVNRLASDLQWKTGRTMAEAAICIAVKAIDLWGVDGCQIVGHQ